MPSRRLLTACLCLNLAAPALADTLATAPVTGIDAAVVQHEVDHLDGILFLDRMEQGGKLYTVETDAEGKEHLVELDVGLAVSD